jgi:hypothetical protein
MAQVILELTSVLPQPLLKPLCTRHERNETRAPWLRPVHRHHLLEDVLSGSMVTLRAARVIDRCQSPHITIQPPVELAKVPTAT